MRISSTICFTLAMMLCYFGCSLAPIFAGGPLVLNPGDTYIIEAGGNSVPPGGISVEGGTLIIRDGATFSGTNPLSVSSGALVIESNTLTTNVFSDSNISGGAIDLQEFARLHVLSEEITVAGGVTFAKAGTFGPAPGNFIALLTIQNGGILTHPPRFEPGLVIQALTLTIESGGQINVTGKGLLGGETYNELGQVVPGAPSDPVFPPGGSHAGFGAPGASTEASPPYGYMEGASQLGAGGGARGGIAGHPGGGRVSIDVDDLNLFGHIRASGENGTSQGAGAGAGGSISIDIASQHSIQGGSVIAADGGSAVVGGGGSGGRVYIRSETQGIFNFHNVVTPGKGGAGGGTSAVCGSCAGLSAEDFGYVFDNGTGITPYRTNLASVGSLNIGGVVEVSTADHPVLSVDAGLHVEGTLTTQPNSPLPLRISAGALSAFQEGVINVRGKGPVGGGHPDNPFGDAGQTVGSDGLTWVAGATNGSGGSFATYGVLGHVDTTFTNPIYGTAGTADYVGSSGASDGTGVGGAAGGRMWISADVCESVPELRADGIGGEFGQGGGSGGSIRLDCQNSDPISVDVSASGVTSLPSRGGDGRVTIRTPSPGIVTVTNLGSDEASIGVDDFVAPRVIGLAFDSISFDPGDVLPPPDPGILSFQFDGPITSLAIPGNFALDPSFLTVSGLAGGAVTPLLPISPEADTIRLGLPGLADDLYTVTLLSGAPIGIHDLGGNLLDGENSGSFPSGDGSVGGDYSFTFRLQSCDDPDADGFGTPGGIGTCPDTDNCPLIANAGQEDGDADGVGDVCDSCPTVSNASQLDANGNGVGDACQTQPIFLVSNDPADEPDFNSIGDALAAATQPDTAIRILQGMGTYLEDLVLDLAVHLLGDLSEGAPPHLTGIQTVPQGVAGTVRFSNLVLAGQNNSQEILTASSDTALDSIDIFGYGGILYDEGTHTAIRISRSGPAQTWVLQTIGSATLDLQYSKLQGVGLASGIWINGGDVSLSHVEVSGFEDGINYPVFANPTSTTIRHSTIAGNVRGITSTIDNGFAPVIEYSVFGDNALSILRLSCANVTNSNIEGACPAPSNLTSAPTFVGGGDYRLQATSAAVDFGPVLAGADCLDLDGTPRLKDADGDGSNQLDFGAYERDSNPALPMQILDLTWATDNSLQWESVSGAVEYHVYRGTASTLSTSLGVCQDPVDANTADTVFDDPDIPAPGESFTYLVGGENGAGAEGSIGFGSCAERAVAQCP